MSNTIVVSTDCPMPITLLTPETLSVSVPLVDEMWMPFPSGHLEIVAVPAWFAAAPTVLSARCGAEVTGAGAGGLVRDCDEQPITARATSPTIL
jgi:hypothetical protein